MEGKIYNALTGLELYTIIPNEVKRELDAFGLDESHKEKIVSEIKKAMENSGISDMAITYPMCSWTWTLSLRQVDEEEHPVSDTPERVVKAGQPDPEGRLVKTLKNFRGGSDRFGQQPPSPTLVRKTEDLPLPEA